MNADCKGALAQLNTSYKTFEHKCKPMSKADVKAVLQYAINKGYEHTGLLSDEEVDEILEQLKQSKVSGKAVVFEGSSKWQSAITTLTVGKAYHVIDDNGVSFKIRNDKGLIKRYFRHYFKEEPMNNNPTRLSQDVIIRIDKEAHDQFPFFNQRLERAIYKETATAYATDRHQLQQENEELRRWNEKLKEQAAGWRPLLEDVLRESGDLPLPIELINKLTKFLYGE